MNNQSDKGEAVMHFVNTLIGAFESGFVDSSQLNLHDLHTAAFHHVKDNYGFDAKRIHEDFGQEVFEACKGETA